MADITMCSSKNCLMKDSCYRAQAQTNSKHQSYYNFEYECNEDSGFDSFIRYEEEGDNE